MTNNDTARRVRSAEAQAKFRNLLDDIARDGAHVYVLRYDKPEAVMVPVGWYERMKATALPGEAQSRLAAIRELLAHFDWEYHDSQLALEAIDRIVKGGGA